MITHVKLHVNHMYVSFIPAAVTIGFDNTDYRVDENVGTVAINIGVINGTLQKKVMISISTENSTAICKPNNFTMIDGAIPSSVFPANVDYTELTNYILTLDSTNISATVNIIIETNDTQREDDEEFIVHLSFPREPIPGVTLDPNKATVRIVEFDGGGTYIHRKVKQEKFSPFTVEFYSIITLPIIPNYIIVLSPCHQYTYSDPHTIGAATV